MPSIHPMSTNLFHNTNLFFPPHTVCNTVNLSNIFHIWLTSLMYLAIQFVLSTFYVLYSVKICFTSATTSPICSYLPLHTSLSCSYLPPHHRAVRLCHHINNLFFSATTSLSCFSLPYTTSLSCSYSICHHITELFLSATTSLSCSSLPPHHWAVRLCHHITELFVSATTLLSCFSLPCTTSSFFFSMFWMCNLCVYKLNIVQEVKRVFRNFSF